MYTYNRNTLSYGVSVGADHPALMMVGLSRGDEMITAKYFGRCVRVGCSRSIRKGDRIVNHGRGVNYHAECVSLPSYGDRFMNDIDTAQEIAFVDARANKLGLDYGDRFMYGERSL